MQCVIQYLFACETHITKISVICRFDVLKDFYTYEPNKPPLTDYQAVIVVLEKVGITGWVNGLHKVFLKFQHPLQLDQHSQHILLHIIAIQRCESHVLFVHVNIHSWTHSSNMYAMSNSSELYPGLFMELSL